MLSQCASINYSTSEVMTLWHYTNLFIIINGEIKVIFNRNIAKNVSTEILKLPKANMYNDIKIILLLA